MRDPRAESGAARSTIERATMAPALDPNPYRSACPTRQILDRIGDRWSVLVIGILASGRTRYTDIAREIEGISQKMLTQTLRALERDGLVNRTVYPEIPPRVEYELTELGRTLQDPLSALEDWARSNMDAVLTARELADAGEPVR